MLEGHAGSVAGSSLLVTPRAKQATYCPEICAHRRCTQQLVVCLLDGHTQLQVPHVLTMWQEAHRFLRQQSKAVFGLFADLLPGQPWIQLKHPST